MTTIDFKPSQVQIMIDGFGDPTTWAPKAYNRGPWAVVDRDGDIETMRTRAEARDYARLWNRDIPSKAPHTVVPNIEAGDLARKRRQLSGKKFGRRKRRSGWERITYTTCDLCNNPAVWRHPEGGLRCETCPRPCPRP